MKYRDIFDFSDKVAVVAGGAGLIGKEIVKGLAEFGATVIIADADYKKAVLIARQYTYLSLKVSSYKLKISEERSVNNFIKVIYNKYKRIDIWVNAAYPRTKDWNAVFENIKSSSWRNNIDIHLNGYFLSCQKIASFMKRYKNGNIINLSSIYGLVAPDFSVYDGTSMTMPAAYSAIKSAVIGFTRYLASYYGGYGIRINSLSPGGVFNGQPELFVRRYKNRTMLKRMANVEDIVGGVIYLASDAARYVTGHNLIIDGGLTSL